MSKGNKKGSKHVMPTKSVAFSHGNNTLILSIVLCHSPHSFCYFSFLTRILCVPFPFCLLVYFLLNHWGLWQIVIEIAVNASCVFMATLMYSFFSYGLGLAMWLSLTSELLANILQAETWEMMITEDCPLYCWFWIQVPTWRIPG